jgi:TATA-box binding protein (TBP) (component of TFIID and TFIIIB)
MLGGMAKYEPKRFAAVVIRVKDNISTTTCLVFHSGNIVVVGALSIYHSLLACQIFRQIIERIACIYKTKDKFEAKNLVNRTTFSHWSISNIVADYNLGCKPDLKYLADIAPEIAKWKHELFPGLRLLVWLKSKKECQCISKKNESCACNCRATIFDTGKFVITGCKNIQSLNICLFQLRLFFSDKKTHEKNEEYLKNIKRFEARRKKLLEAAVVEFGGWTKTNGEIEEEEEPENILETVLDELKKQYTRKTTHEKDKYNDMEPLFKACKYEQMENVEFLCKIKTKEEIETTIQQCENLKFNNEIIYLLREELSHKK